MHWIAIVGGSGAGKTWLAERLASALDSQVVGRASLDNFYSDLSHLPPEERAKANFDHPDAIDWEKVEEVVDAMARGQVTAMPAYDFATHTREAHPILWNPKPIVIWEGLWLLHPLWLRQRFSLTVYVECPLAVRLARRCERDGRERGRSEPSVQRQFVDQVIPMHERFVAPQKQLAQSCVESPISVEALRRLIRQVKDLV